MNVQFGVKITGTGVAKEDKVRRVVKKAFVGEDIDLRVPLYKADSPDAYLGDLDEFMYGVLADKKAPRVSNAYFVVPGEHLNILSDANFFAVDEQVYEEEGAVLESRVKTLLDGTRVVSLVVDSSRHHLVRDLFGAEPSEPNVFMGSANTVEDFEDDLEDSEMIFNVVPRGLYEAYFVADKNKEPYMRSYVRERIEKNNGARVSFSLRTEGDAFVLGAIFDTAFDVDARAPLTANVRAEWARLFKLTQEKPVDDKGLSS